mmetsp:Transcript_6967/g.20255  ORF Transcript_6967/g.20255 Transcript_6967/m.20255 type:complete len:181 (+) Transcript_6967:18-560(+)
MAPLTTALLSVLALSPCTTAIVVDLQGAQSAGVIIKAAPRKGMGAFTVERRTLGDVLGCYGGERFDQRTREARYLRSRPLRPCDRVWLRSRKQRGVPVSEDYLLYLGNGEYVDAEDRAHSNWCRYINHDSENPCLGVFMEAWPDGRSHPTFIAIRTCIPGEELSFDYGVGFWDKCDYKPV